MARWIGSKNQQLHIELTSFCQASCPACSRVYDYSSQIEGRKTHSSWSLDQLKSVFSQEVLGNVSEILLCGNYGDPLGFDQLDQFIEHCLSQSPRIRFIIHTNGGLGSKELWQKLGKLLSKDGHQVKVSIDGLEDTNHLYRRGVVWSKLLENMRSFIDSGGRPYWKFIIFDYNAHQKDQAHALSQELGFYKFEERLPYGDSNGHIEASVSSALPSDLQTDFKKTSDIELTEDVFQGISEAQIDCKVLAQPSLYFDHDQRVWPCCWLAQDGDHRTRTKKRELFFRKVFDRGIAQNFNDLKDHSLLEILSHPFYEDLLPSSWSSKAIAKKECFATCLSTCPKKN